jgi:branched-chain amino acid transport system permease protein
MIDGMTHKNSHISWLLPLGGLGVCFVLSLIPLQDWAPYYGQIILLAGLNIALAVSLNLVNGITGQFSLGHAGFMSIGAYTCGALSVFFPKLVDTVIISEGFTDGLVFLVGMILGGLLAAGAGYIVGLPSLRLKGDYLAIVTLGFGEVMAALWRNIDSLGGPRGLSVPSPQAGPFSIFAVALITVLVVQRITDSTHGRAMLSIREDEVAAESIGVDTTGYKVRAFVISSFFAGLAGALFIQLIGQITPETFSFVKSTEIVVMVVLGGLGSTSGAVIAAIILTFLPEALRPLKDYTGLDLRMVIYSALLVVLMLVRPSGLLGKSELWNLKRSKEAA